MHKISYYKQFPKKHLNKEGAFYFIDAYFKNKGVFESIEKKMFLQAGEKIKSFSFYEKLVQVLVENNIKKKGTVYCVGGGSMGDVIGFVASTYLRGVSFIQVPTTYLAAVDSSLGGKTALNFKKYKNQIGSFYPAQEILMCEDLYKSSSLKDAEGEILKKLFLNYNKTWAKKILKNWNSSDLQQDLLKSLNDYKIQIVKKDPFDSQNKRAVLNLGHTLAHIIELPLALTHGEAVKIGLRFCLAWSYERGYLVQKTFEALKDLVEIKLPQISKETFFLNLDKDKKALNDEKVNFVFLTEKGPVTKKVEYKDMYHEYLRQSL